MSLTVVADSLRAESGGLLFEANSPSGLIQCAISEDALRDLLDFHAARSTKDETSRLVLSEIERLAAAKCELGRFEQNGWVVIRAADLLRYGYEAKPAA